jgi:hypothetical protein
MYWPGTAHEKRDREHGYMLALQLLHTAGNCAQLPLQLLKFYRLLLQQ